MIITNRKLRYRAFGTTILSEIPLPELHELQKDTAASDEIEIVIGDLAAKWRAEGNPERNHAVIDGHFYFHNPTIATFSVQEGRRIVVSPEPDSDYDIIRLLILGTCMGALLFQRKILPLHGSAVVIDGKAYAIIGDKGAGKSTLTAAFLSKGYSMLTDDVIAVTIDGETGQPVVIPAYPQQKLWQESLDYLNLNTNAFNPLYQQFNKYSVPIDSNFCLDRIPLAGIFELTKAPVQGIELESVTGLERFPLLLYHTYRNFLIPMAGLERWHFQTTAHILNHVAIHTLKRPLAGFTAYELQNQILKTTLKGA